MLKNTTKLLFVFIIVFFIIAISLTSCNDDDNENNTTNDTDITEIIDSSDNNQKFSEIVYSIPKETSYLQNSNDFILDIFFPIGWSEDGKFAYIYEPVDEATGYYFFTFEIKDMKNNEVIWTWEIGKKDEIYEGSVKDIWNKNKDEFRKILVKNKIVQNKDFKLKQFPIIDKGKTYNLVENIKYRKTTNDFGFDKVRSAEFKLKAKSKKTKTVFEKKYSDDMILNVAMNTYLKSPFENRIATIVTKQICGYEGPPHVVMFDIVGFALDF